IAIIRGRHTYDVSEVVNRRRLTVSSTQRTEVLHPVTPSPKEGMILPGTSGGKAKHLTQIIQAKRYGVVSPRQKTQFSYRVPLGRSKPNEGQNLYEQKRRLVCHSTSSKTGPILSLKTSPTRLFTTDHLCGDRGSRLA